MSKKTETKIASNKIQKYAESDKFVKPNISIPIEIEGEIFNITVKPRLSLEETISFTNKVVDDVVNRKTGIISYEVKDFLIRLNLVNFYTNIQLPQNISKSFSILYNTDLYNLITTADGFDKDFFLDLTCSIENQINYEVEKLLKKSKLDDLLDMVMGIVSKMDKNIDFQKAFDTLDKISKIEKIDEKALVNAIAESKETK